MRIRGRNLILHLIHVMHDTCPSVGEDGLPLGLGAVLEIAAKDDARDVLDEVERERQDLVDQLFLA